MCYSVARDGTRDSVLALGRSGSFLRGISGAPFPFRCSRPRRRTVPRSAERLPPQVVGGEWALTVGRVPRAPGSVTSLSVSENGTRILGPGGFFRPVRLKERKLEESTRIQNKGIFTQVWPKNLSARVCCHRLGGRAPHPTNKREQIGVEAGAGTTALAGKEPRRNFTAIAERTSSFVCIGEDVMHHGMSAHCWTGVPAWSRRARLLRNRSCASRSIHRASSAWQDCWGVWCLAVPRHRALFVRGSWR